MAGLKPCPCTSHQEHREGLHGARLALCPAHIRVSRREGSLCTRLSCGTLLHLGSPKSPPAPLQHWHKWHCQFSVHERFPALAGHSRYTPTFDPTVNAANLNFPRLGSLPSFTVKCYSNAFPAAQFLPWKQKLHFCNAAVRPV